MTDLLMILAGGALAVLLLGALATWGPESARSAIGNAFGYWRPKKRGSDEDDDGDEEL